MQERFQLDRLLPPAGHKPALSPRALDIRSGAWRLMAELGFAAQAEVRLKTARHLKPRRADLLGVNRAGDLLLVEIKSCAADWRADSKWQDYLGFCDRFYFAVDEDFPHALLSGEDALPATTGLIIADRFGGSIVREAAPQKLAPARRKKLLLELALAGGRRQPMG